MASDMFEIGDVLVCVDDSPHGGFAYEGNATLKKNQAYEVERHGIGRECFLVGVPDRAWKQSRFRRATLGEIRMYRRKQGFEKHQFAVGDLVVCLVNDTPRFLSIGRTCVVSATKSDYEHEGFVDIDGGENPSQYFAAYFRKATPAETAAYRKANGGPPFKAAPKPASKNYSPVDSINSVEVGDTIVFTGRSDLKGPQYGAVAIVQGVTFMSGNEIHELWIHVPGRGWSFVTPHFWVPVGKGYELVAQGQPIETGDEWFEPVAPKGWYPTSFRTEEKYTKTTDGILRRKVKEKATVVGVAGCDIKPGQLVTVGGFIDDPIDPSSHNATKPAQWLSSDDRLPTVTVKYEWDGTVKPKRVGKMPVVPGNPAENAEESLNRAISFPKDFLLRSDDGREFEVIDWKPNVTMDEAVTVEAKLMVFQDPVKKPKATPFKMGDLVVCTDSTDQHVAPADRIAQGRTYQIEGFDSYGFLRIGGMRGFRAPSRFRPAMVCEITRYWDKLGFPNHQFKVADIVVCVDARPYDSTIDLDEVVELEEGRAYRVEAVRSFDVKPSGCLVWWNRVRFRLATPAEAQAFLHAEQASKKWEPKPGDSVVCINAKGLPIPLSLGAVYKVASLRCNTTDTIGLDGHSLYYKIDRFRPATPAEAQAFLHAEKQPPTDPGIGYRFLDKAELVVEGDEYWDDIDRTWASSSLWDRFQVKTYVYRRRNQFAFGELVQIIKPVTQALRDESPVWLEGPMNYLDGKVLEMPKTSPSSNDTVDIDIVSVDYWNIAQNWLAPASSEQKKAHQDKKDKKAKADDLRKQIAALQVAVRDLEASS